jgi:hypothetical protein
MSQEGKDPDAAEPDEHRLDELIAHVTESRGSHTDESFFAEEAGKDAEASIEDERAAVE